MIREIISMKANGLSNSQISLSLGKSRTTIVKYLRAIESSGISMKGLPELKEADLSKFLEFSDDLNSATRKHIHLDLYAFFPLYGEGMVLSHLSESNIRI